MLAMAMVFRWRPDGDEVTDVPLTRRIMPMLMPTRNESVVYFDLDVEAAPIDDVVTRLRTQGLQASVLHVVSTAAVRVLAERPRLNRFVVGGRLFQRRGIWVAYSAKKEKSDSGSIFVTKRCIDPKASLIDVTRQLQESIAVGRSDAKSSTDIELSLAFHLPLFVVAFLVGLLKRLDQWGLLPRSLIDSDPMFASIFFANLGSLGMDAPQHHLFEYGNIPLFCAMGQRKSVFVEGPDGMPQKRVVYPLRFSFDERVEDGLYCLTSLRRLQALLTDQALWLSELAAAAAKPAATMAARSP
jgi:hypothetical protein